MMKGSARRGGRANGRGQGGDGADGRRAPAPAAPPVVAGSELGPLPGPPLPALLDAALTRFVNRFQALIEQTPHAELRLAHSSNVLRWLQGGPQRPADLVGLSGVSKQAISQQVARMIELGYVEAAAHPTDGRAHLVQLTPRGEDAQRVVHELFERIEAEWRAQLPGPAWDAFRTGLVEVSGTTAPTT